MAVRHTTTGFFTDYTVAAGHVVEVLHGTILNNGSVPMTVALYFQPAGSAVVDEFIYCSGLALRATCSGQVSRTLAAGDKLGVHISAGSFADVWVSGKVY